MSFLAAFQGERVATSALEVGEWDAHYLDCCRYASAMKDKSVEVVRLTVIGSRLSCDSGYDRQVLAQRQTILLHIYDGEHSMTFVNRSQIGISESDANISSFRLKESSCPKRYENVTVDFDYPSHTIWCRMRPSEVPTYSHAMMADISLMQNDVRELFSSSAREQSEGLRWFVMASDAPGIFNLGGDLAHFAERIRQRDFEALRRYGHVAVSAIYQNTVAFETSLVTMALVQGDALGGGFEHALSFDLIVAERSAKLGLPEILFNMFPGMGAYSFLSRRLDRARAEALIFSGRIHTAAELHAMGIVDVLAEDGEGALAVREYIAKHDPKHNAHRGIHRARRCVNPVTLAELQDVVDIWAEAAMNLSDANLSKMERLSRAQVRRVAVSQETDA